MAKKDKKIRDKAAEKAVKERLSRTHLKSVRVVGSEKDPESAGKHRKSGSVPEGKTCNRSAAPEPAGGTCPPSPPCAGRGSGPPFPGGGNCGPQTEKCP